MIKKLEVGCCVFAVVAVIVTIIFREVYIMVLNNICLHVVEFRIDYGDELQYYICGFSNYGSIKRFINDVRYNDKDCLSIRCNDVTTVIMDLKMWLCNGFDTIDYENIFNNHFNRIYKRA